MDGPAKFGHRLPYQEFGGPRHPVGLSRRASFVKAMMRTLMVNFPKYAEILGVGGDPGQPPRLTVSDCIMMQTTTTSLMESWK